MRITICAVGRLRGGPEADLVLDYCSRLDRIGRSFGLGPVDIREVEDKKNAGKAAEADLLRRALPRSGIVCCLDERGTVEPSPDFAKRLGRWRDMGLGDLAFVIGGADGIDADLRSEADHMLSFGKMVWPHMLARVMLCEQLYRAATIISGGPYHRS